MLLRAVLRCGGFDVSSLLFGVFISNSCIFRAAPENCRSSAPGRSCRERQHTAAGWRAQGP